MTKKLKVKVFTDMDSLCNFVNQNCITQENIQTITSVCVKDTAIDTIYYWEIKE